MSIKIDLGPRSYEVYIDDSSSRILEVISQAQRPVLITDKNVKKYHAEFFSHIKCPILIIEPGETAKSVETLTTIWNWLAENTDRTGTVFAMGGGVIGDLVGFAAASFNRGIALYHIPTTLLACVDSGIGGKTGINITAGKNLVGAFWQPQGVLINTSFLKTLPKDAYDEAFGEIIKYGLIKDSELFNMLEELPRIDAMSPDLKGIIETCVKIKGEVVSKDETESNLRMLLNLGHTFGHAIEAVAGYGEYFHGEAISIGLCMACELSDVDADRLKAICLKYNLPVALRQPLSKAELCRTMWHDKKVIGKKIQFVLLRQVGEAYVSTDVDFSRVEELWLAYGAK